MKRKTKYTVNEMIDMQIFSLSIVDDIDIFACKDRYLFT